VSEDSLLHNQILLIRDIDQRSGDQKCVFINEAVGLDHEMNKSLLQLAALDLNRDVPSLGHMVENSVKAAVEKRQEGMQQAMRLTDEVRPDLELQRLSRAACVAPLGHVPRRVRSTERPGRRRRERRNPLTLAVASK